MHKSRLSNIIIDCQTTDIDAAARFWADAIGRTLQSDAEAGDPYRLLEGAPDEMKILVQAVEHESRVHLDIETDDVESEASRLERLGARRIEKVKTWWVMQAPSGQRFCVVRPQRADFERKAHVWHGEHDTLSHVAKGEFVVKLAPLPVEGQPDGSGFARMSIDKTLSGDLVATTVGQMLSAMTQVQGSAAYVAIERVEGALHGRRGSFVLQHTGVMHRGAPSLSVTVVPDSGSGELAGLAGDFKILISNGQHRYEFSYTLPRP